MDALYRRILQVVIFWMGFCLVTLALTDRCVLAGEAQGFSIESPAFANNATIPLKFTCSGANQSPPLTWRGAPAKTRSYLLVMRDPDAPGRDFIHWVVFNIPGDTHELEPGIGRSGPPAQAANSFGRIGYDGPCPPPGPVHHYKFELMALDATLDPSRAASVDQIESQAAAHRLATAELIGAFAR